MFKKLNFTLDGLQKQNIFIMNWELYGLYILHFGFISWRFTIFILIWFHELNILYHLIAGYVSIRTVCLKTTYLCICRKYRTPCHGMFAEINSPSAIWKTFSRAPLAPPHEMKYPLFFPGKSPLLAAFSAPRNAPPSLTLIPPLVRPPSKAPFPLAPFRMMPKPRRLQRPHLMENRLQCRVIIHVSWFIQIRRI